MPPACLSMEIRPRTNAMLSSTGHCLAHRASFPYSSKGITNREAIILLAFIPVFPLARTATAFDVKPGQRLFIPPADRVRIW